ncbi:hypothetical protein D3C87_2039630 [compost metagenome]
MMSALRRSCSERLTDTLICSGQSVQSRHARSMMKRVMSQTIPISSAISMKILGGIGPLSGCVQRDSASQHDSSDPSGRYMG